MDWLLFLLPSGRRKTTLRREMSSPDAHEALRENPEPKE
jgi:hypothetical protein